MKIECVVARVVSPAGKHRTWIFIEKFRHLGAEIILFYKLPLKENHIFSISQELFAFIMPNLKALKIYKSTISAYQLNAV